MNKYSKPFEKMTKKELIAYIKEMQNNPLLIQAVASHKAILNSLETKDEESLEYKVMMIADGLRCLRNKVTAMDSYINQVRRGNNEESKS